MWDPYERGDVSTLKKAQRRAARFVKGDHKRESSVKQMTCDLGWQNLDARRALSRLSLMYKITNGLVDVESQILVRSWVLLENPKVNTTSGISYSLQSFIFFSHCP